MTAISTTRRRAAAIAGPAAVFGLSLGIFLLCLDRMPSFLDVGFNANSALRVSRGEVPYRDFFSLVTPLSFFINAGVILAFGPTLAALQAAAAVIAAILYTTLYALARQLMPAGWALLAWACAMVYSPAMLGVTTAYSTTATMFAVAAMLLVVLGLRRDDARLTFAAGVACGLCLATKQTIGAYILLSLGLFFAFRLRRRAMRRHVAAVLGGTAAVGALLLSYLAANGAIGAFLDDCLIVPLRYFSAEARRLPPELADLGWDAEGVEPLLYFVAIGSVLFTWAGLAICAARRRPVDDAVLLVALGAGCLLLITRERYSFHNLLCVTPPIFLLLVRPIQLAWSGPRPGRQLAIAGALGLAVFVGFGGRFIHFRHSVLNVALYDGHLAFARQVFRDYAGKRIVVLPYAPFFYFDARASNPTRFDLVIPGNLSPADKLEFARDLSTKVDVVLFHEFWAFDGASFRNYNSEIAETMARDFDPVLIGPHGQIVYLRRREGGPPARPGEAAGRGATTGPR